MEVAHSCGVRNCVNPRHLRWATALANQHDRYTHGTDNRGERNSHAHLTAEQVIEIRARYEPRHGALRRLAQEFGVHPCTINDVVKGRSWRHLL